MANIEDVHCMICCFTSISLSDLKAVFLCKTCERHNVTFCVNVSEGDQVARYFTLCDIVSLCQRDVRLQEISSQDKAKWTFVSGIHDTRHFLSLHCGNGVCQHYNLCCDNDISFVLQTKEAMFRLNPDCDDWKIYGNINYFLTKSSERCLQVCNREDIVLTCGQRTLFQIHAQSNIPELQIICSLKLVEILKNEISSKNTATLCEIERCVSHLMLPLTIKEGIKERLRRYIFMCQVFAKKRALDIGDHEWKYGTDDRCSLFFITCLRNSCCPSDG